MLTVDVPVAGKRERDLRNGMAVPPQLGLATLAEAAAHPRWCWSYLTQPGLRFANLEGGSAPAGRGSIMSYIDSQFDPSVDWSAAAAMIERWNGPFAIKGVLCPEDAIRAVEIGATGVIVSNHGGRQLDGAPSSIRVLPEIVDAVGHKTEVLMDSGIRSGQDVLKALALGAKGTFVGRAMAFGLGAGGEAGVTRALNIIQKEMDTTMALMGERDVRNVGPHNIYSNDLLKRQGY
jgi:L-lactate dehydrogenase (cytochrome)